MHEELRGLVIKTVGMADLLKALDMGPYTLVAPCVNVFTALSVAEENPAIVERLVLMQAIEWQDQCEWANWAQGRFMLAVAMIPAFGDRVVATPYLGQWIWAGAQFIAGKGMPNDKLQGNISGGICSSHLLRTASANRVSLSR